MKSEKDTPQQPPYEKTLDKAKARWRGAFYEFCFKSGNVLYYKCKEPILQAIRSLYSSRMQIEGIFFYGKFPKNNRKEIANKEALLRRLRVKEGHVEKYWYVDKVFLTESDTSNISQN